MENYFGKLFQSDPLFRALVLSHLQAGGNTIADPPLAGDLVLTQEEEIEILREYAITLFREHKNLKTLFLESLNVSGRSIGTNKTPQRKQPR